MIVREVGVNQSGTQLAHQRSQSVNGPWHREERVTLQKRVSELEIPKPLLEIVPPDKRVVCVGPHSTKSFRLSQRRRGRSRPSVERRDVQYPQRL